MCPMLILPVLLLIWKYLLWSTDMAEILASCWKKFCRNIFYWRKISDQYRSIIVKILNSSILEHYFMPIFNQGPVFVENIVTIGPIFFYPGNEGFLTFLFTFITQPLISLKVNSYKVCRAMPQHDFKWTFYIKKEIHCSLT